MQQKITAALLRGKDEKARQELTSGLGTARLCKPYLMQHRHGWIRWPDGPDWWQEQDGDVLTR